MGITHLVKSRIDLIQKNLESILDQEIWKPQKSSLKSFEVQTDLSLVQNISYGLPETQLEKAILIFSRLTPYFNSGIFLTLRESSRSRESWISSAAFQDGIYFQLPKNVWNEALHLPTLKLGELRKTAPYVLLSPLQLNDLCDLPDANAFVFKPTDQILFLLFSNLPEPWLRPQIETIHNEVVKSFYD